LTFEPGSFWAAWVARVCTAEMSRTALSTPSGSWVRGGSIPALTSIDQTPADSSNPTLPMSSPLVQAFTHHPSSLWTKSEVMLLMAAS
jgi:hypothetical protein